jgi:pimeloyl-ACP methyl ester carboxylesterase
MERCFFAIVVFLGWTASSVRAQETDVFLDVRGDRLHFHILKGSGVPILFEAGGGDDGTVWASITKPLHDITHATMITYDRAGFGRSELNATERAVDKHGIQNGVEELEEALKRLGYNDHIMLVAHSYGALYATLYAARHPTVVKAAVLVDGSSACWFTDDWIENFVKDRQSERNATTEDLGSYYQSANLPKTIEIMRATAFPQAIPVIDLVSENPPFSNNADIARWKECHRHFAKAQSNREGITAYGSGHYIFKDNPPLVTHVIVKAYISIVDGQEAEQILRRQLDYAIQTANESKRQQVAGRH